MERGERRPPVPDIPGLVKGVGFAGKGKIELQKELWAERRRARFPEIRADLAVIAKDKEFFLDLPYLAVEESDAPFVQHWVPKVDSVTGGVFTSRWQTPSSLDPDKFVAFAGQKYYDGIDLTAIPESWEVTRLVPQRVKKGLEFVMRQKQEMGRDYGSKGVEQARIYTVLSQIYSSTEVFLREQVTDEDLRHLAKETERVLKQEGLIGARDSIWKKIVNYTLRAATRDIRNRINPGRSRILERAAYLALTDRELIMREVQRKARRVYSYVGRVRAITRQNFTIVVDIIERQLDNPVFHTGQRWLSPRVALGISYNLKTAWDILEKVQAAPYLLPARETQAILVGKIGKSREEINELTRRLAVGGAASLRELQRDHPAEEYLRSLDGTSSHKRMRQGLQRIQEVLANPDNFEITVFD